MSVDGLSLRERREKMSYFFRQKENDLRFRESRFKQKTIPFSPKPNLEHAIEIDPLLESFRLWINYLNSDEDLDEQKVIAMQGFFRENIGILDKLKHEPAFSEIAAEMSFELVIKKIIGLVAGSVFSDRLWHVCAYLTTILTCRISRPTCMALFRIIETPTLPQKDFENLLVILINFYSDSPDLLDELLLAVHPWEILHRKLSQLIQNNSYSEVSSLLDFLNLIVFKAFVHKHDNLVDEALLREIQKLTQTIFSALPNLPNRLQAYSLLVWVLYARLLLNPSEFLTRESCEETFEFLGENTNNLQAAELMFTFVDLLGDYLDPQTAKTIIYPQLQSIVQLLKKVLLHNIIDLRQNGLQILSNLFAITHDIFLIQSIQAEGIAQMTIEAFRTSNDHSFEIVCLRFLDNYIKGVKMGESGGEEIDFREDFELVDALFDKMKHCQKTPTDLVLQYLDCLESLLDRSTEVGFWKQHEENEITRFICNNMFYIYTLDKLMFEGKGSVPKKAESIIDQFLREDLRSRGFTHFNDD